VAGLLLECLATAWGHLLASWRKMKFSRLTVGGVVGVDVVQLLGGVLENVVVLALAQVPRAAFRSHTSVSLVSFGLGALAPLP
jgi:hypothetical protein